MRLDYSVAHLSLVNSEAMIEDLPDTPLVSAAWLTQHLENPNLRVVDTRFLLGKPEAGNELYRAGHIPNAAFVDLERDLSATVRPDRVGGRHPLPAPAVLAARLGTLGIGDEHLVIAYDDPGSGQGFYAAHLWWLLRFLGHDAVRVLDGGITAWVAAGGQLEAGTVTLEPTVFTARPRLEMIVGADDVQQRSSETVLIDSRAAKRYSGELEPLDPVGGHIPGAVNIDWAQGIVDTQWLEREAQRERFAQVTDAEEIIVYCGSGVSAGGNLLALEIAGVQGAKLYAGSWSDWVSDPQRPVATGSKS